MLSRWPIFYKLLLAFAALFLIIGMLSFSGFQGVYAYRHLVHSINRRTAEMPIADALTQNVIDMREAFMRFRPRPEYAPTMFVERIDASPQQRENFSQRLGQVKATLGKYREQLQANAAVDPDGELLIDDVGPELLVVGQIDERLSNIEQLLDAENGILQEFEITALDHELAALQNLTTSLPHHLFGRMQKLVGEVRGQYRTWSFLSWGCLVLTAVLLVVLVAFVYVWIFRPLKSLVVESRLITAGDLSHRIKIDTHDEVAELARAMNDMTAEFQRIRDNLDEQVRQRTQEVVRSEQLASVGFLAAGVAHEINNPLASIAWCAESLDSRLDEVVEPDELPESDPRRSEVQVMQKYLRRIQDEAFRCKGITEKLLDFSRLGHAERQETELSELVQGVIEMAQTLGKYRGKRVEFTARERVVASVQPQEMKQVLLNLLTNALDSVDQEQGVVTVELRKSGSSAELSVRDNGCGMTPEVKRHLFEPFFTRRRDGQGTGLGLSITYRIVQDNGGTIDAFSDGPGRGATFRVLLPLASAAKKKGGDSGVFGIGPPRPLAPAA